MHLLALQQLRTSHAWQRREIEGSGGSLAQKPIGTPKPAAQAAPARHSPIGLIAIGVIVLIAIAVLFFRTTDTRWPRGSDSNPA